MPFGAWSPLPLRLGADPERGWSSQSQSRFAADLVAVRRTIPLAQITIDTSTGALVSYTSQYGVGSSFAPAFSTIGAGHFGLAWAKAYQYFDEIFYAFNIRSADLTAQGSAPVACTYGLNTGGGLPSFDFWCTNLLTSAAASPIVTITVWGDWLPDRKIGDYDGATDKGDSLTEGDSSYCYDWSIELQAMRGSAYSTITGNVDAENFAMARQLGGLNRTAEKLEANSLPGTSDEKLENWVSVLGVSVRGSDQRWQIRQRCEAKLKAATSSGQPADTDEAIRTLLGDSFTAVHRNTGASLASPPTGTYWPVFNPGTTGYSLGGGAWFSERSFLWVEVAQPSSSADADFDRLMNVDLIELLDLRLPAHMTFNWATTNGFLIGVSQLGFASL